MLLNRIGLVWLLSSFQSGLHLTPQGKAAHRNLSLLKGLVRKLYFSNVSNNVYLEGSRCNGVLPGHILRAGPGFDIIFSSISVGDQIKLKGTSFRLAL